MKIILVKATNKFKWRIFGSESDWTELVGGVEHEILAYPHQRVEIKSIDIINNIHVKGDAEIVHITKSVLTSLEDSFSGSNSIKTVSVVSDEDIQNMEHTFKNSTINDFDIPTDKVENFYGTFEETKNIEQIDVKTDSATNMDTTFRNSDVKIIDAILPFNNCAFEMLKSTIALESIIGGVDFMEDCAYQNTLIDSPYMHKIGLEQIRGRLSSGRGLYLNDWAIEWDESYTLQLDIGIQRLFLYQRADTINQDSYNSTLSYSMDSSKTFEMDLVVINQQDILTRREYLGDMFYNDLDESFDNSKTFELNVKIINQQDILTRREYLGDIFSNDLDDSFDSNNTVELDLIIGKQSELFYRKDIDDSYSIDLSESFDSSNNFELDLVVSHDESIFVRRDNEDNFENTLSDSFDGSQKFELDLVIFNQMDILTRGPYNDDDDDSIDNSKTFELDLSIVPEPLVYLRVDLSDIDSSSIELNTDTDASKYFEMDIYPNNDIGIYRSVDYDNDVTLSALPTLINSSKTFEMDMYQDSNVLVNRSVNYDNILFSTNFVLNSNASKTFEMDMYGSSNSSARRSDLQDNGIASIDFGENIDTSKTFEMDMYQTSYGTIKRSNIDDGFGSIYEVLNDSIDQSKTFEIDIHSSDKDNYITRGKLSDASASNIDLLGNLVSTSDNFFIEIVGRHEIT